MKQRGSAVSPAWLELASLVVLSMYFYVFMEWFFYATKPSFMDFMPFLTRLGILLLPGLLFAAGSLALLLALYIVLRLPVLGRFPRVWLGLGALLPGAFLAAAALMMVDNFTYTVFKFGVVSSKGVFRGVYGLFFLALLGWFTVWASRRIFRRLSQQRMVRSLRRRLFASAALLALSIAFGGALYLSAPTTDPGMQVGAPARTPNVLLLGSDGLNVDDMSIYGGQPDTTPYLRELAGHSLVGLNNFTNANITSGSLVAMFTSKLPTSTRMLYPPDVLKGNDSFQHLPGILKNAGYYNAEISVDFYADPNMLNLQDGFVMVNGRSATIGRLYTLTRRYLPENAAYFLSMIAKRLTDRLMHIYYVREMPNPYAAVTQQLSTMSDIDRMGMVISLFRDIRQPLFIHAHMMGTHVDDAETYHQAIRDFDGYVHSLLSELEQMGRLEETVVIVYTDHGHQNASNVRTPLLIRFPNREHARRITSSTQNLDIAPTILEYMGIQPPAWMAGKSLLESDPPMNRAIYNMVPNYRVDIGERLQLDTSKTQPPFYQFGVVNMIVCHKWYALETNTLAWAEGEIAHYPTPCQPGELPDMAQAKEMIRKQMEADGFDVTTLGKAIKE